VHAVNSLFIYLFVYLFILGMDVGHFDYLWFSIMSN